MPHKHFRATVGIQTAEEFKENLDKAVKLMNSISLKIEDLEKAKLTSHPAQ